MHPTPSLGTLSRFHQPMYPSPRRRQLYLAWLRRHPRFEWGHGWSASWDKTSWPLQGNAYRVCRRALGNPSAPASSNPRGHPHPDISNRFTLRRYPPSPVSRGRGAASAMRYVRSASRAVRPLMVERASGPVANRARNHLSIAEPISRDQLHPHRVRPRPRLYCVRTIAPFRLNFETYSLIWRIWGQDLAQFGKNISKIKKKVNIFWKFQK